MRDSFPILYCTYQFQLVVIPPSYTIDIENKNTIVVIHCLGEVLGNYYQVYFWIFQGLEKLLQATFVGEEDFEASTGRCWFQGHRPRRESSRSQQISQRTAEAAESVSLYYYSVKLLLNHVELLCWLKLLLDSGVAAVFKFFLFVGWLFFCHPNLGWQVYQFFSLQVISLTMNGRCVRVELVAKLTVPNLTLTPTNFFSSSIKSIV